MSLDFFQYRLLISEECYGRKQRESTNYTKAEKQKGRIPTGNLPF
jgi:hypothetical protein